MVLRFWVTAHFIDAAKGVAVPGATCTMGSNGTAMTFSRLLGGRDGFSRPITPGTAQEIIAAHGSSGQLALQLHTFQTSLQYDFGSGYMPPPVASQAAWYLYVHALLMVAAWGTLIPWGVGIANRARNFGGKGAWFRVHRRLNTLGWLLQLLGFAAAVYMAWGGAHFDTTHSKVGLAVVTVGTMQPLNALIRPHAPASGEPKPTIRALWEVLHKGLGWLCTLAGIVNVILGLLLAISNGVDSAFVCIIASAVGLGTGSALLMFIESLASSRGKMMTFCVRSCTRVEHDGVANDIGTSLLPTTSGKGNVRYVAPELI